MQDQLTLHHGRQAVSPCPVASAVHQPLFPARGWTGGEATALRKALRMTEGRFARSVGVSPRTVSNWAQYPAMVPRSAAQDMLDELLAATKPTVRDRFEQLAGEQPVGSGAVAAGGGVAAQVVSLGAHPRYAADFRALACGQVSAARAALGMSTEDFRV